jgi:hypothetical protein
MVGMARFAECGLRMGAAGFAREQCSHNDAACVYEPGAGSDTGVDEEAQGDAASAACAISAEP